MSATTELCMAAGVPSLNARLGVLAERASEPALGTGWGSVRVTSPLQRPGLPGFLPSFPCAGLIPGAR